MLATRDPLLDQLFLLLSGADAVVAAGDWDALLALAKMRNVDALVAQRVLSGDVRMTVPDDVQARLRALQEDTTHRSMRRLRDFAAAASELQSRGIPVIALKGMQLVPLVYRSLAARSMVDVDLLVPAARLAEADAAMRSIGYEPHRPYRVSDDAVPYYMHHVPPFKKSGASNVELHWHISPPRTAVTVDIAELWERAVPARIGGVDARVFAIEDLLLHLAVHATYNHRCEISVRACCDVAEIASTQVISWEAVTERARRWNIAGGTYLVLRLARELLDAPIPAEALGALEPPDFDDSLLHIALRGEVDRSRAGRLRHAGGVMAKLRTVKQLLFGHRDDLADEHNLARSSPLVYGLQLQHLARFVAKLPKRLPAVVAAHRDGGRIAAESAAIDALLDGARR